MNGNIEKIYGLTPLQEGFLFYKLLNPDSSEYILQFSIPYNEGPLVYENIFQSLKLLFIKHDVLRTAFSMFDISSKPLQIILKNREPELNIVNLCEKKSFEEIIDADLKRGFDIEKDSLFRVTVVNLGDGSYVLICTIHHAIVDGWCLSIIVEDFMKYYSKLCSGISFENLLKTIQKEQENSPSYSDYVAWLERQDQLSALKYWDNLLENYNEAASIEGLNQKGNSVSSTSYKYLRLSPQIHNKLKKIASTRHITMNNIMELAWGVLLQKYTGKKDVVFGRVVSGRNVPIKGIERVVGLFLNTVPVRVKCEKNETILQALESIHNQMIESSQYDYCSLPEIQNKSKLGMNLFDSIIIYENYYVNPDVNQNITHYKPTEKKYLHDSTHYPLTLSIDIDDDLLFSLQYDSNKYTNQQAKLILEHLKNILMYFIHSLEQDIDKVEMITNAEKNLIVNSFNSKAINVSYRYPMMVEYFESQVKKSPKEIAIIDGKRSITYEQLNARANCLALQLRDNGIKPNDFVALIVERSVEMVVGIYAILKAGAAYVPIDPNYPMERIKYILDDCLPKVVLTNRENLNSLNISCPILKIKDRDCPIEQYKNLCLINKPDDYIYCMYTSGTTGKPKGVLCKNSGLVDRINWIQKTYPLSSTDAVLCKTTYTFDPSVWEIFWWNWVGARLVILPPDSEKDPRTIIDYIVNFNISTIVVVPSVLKLLLNFLKQNNFNKKNHLKIVLSIGESLSGQTVKDFYEIFSKSKLINTYGPTEASINVTSVCCNRDDVITTIGKPIDNVQIYICEENQLCGIGIPGELCISGIGVAAGYLNQEELTKEKFIDNPFGDGKLYRTGDLAKWLSDGNIEFLGRIDDQIKIHGMRIELGEIERNLIEDEYINDAVVIAKENSYGEKSLYAYITGDDKIDISLLRERLKKVVPLYMIPSYFMQIDKIPIASNGKLDRNKLPNIEIKSTTAYVEPRNDIEKTVARAFEEVLDINRVGIYDNFFELGGDSIKAIRIISKLREKGFEINISDLMKSTNVESVSNSIQYEDKYAISKNKSIVSFDKMPLGITPTQKYLYYWHSEDLFGTIIEFVNPINIEQLKRSMELTLIKHKFLSASYNDNSVIPKKTILDFVSVQIGESDSNVFEKLKNNISLENGSLLQVAICNENMSKKIWICVSKLVCDAYTWSIIIKEITEVYRNLNKKIVFDNEQINFSMVDWEQFKNSYCLDSEQIALWENNYSCLTTDILTDKKNTHKNSTLVESRKVEENELQRLKKAAEIYHADVRDLMVVALCATLNKKVEKQPISISLLDDGRFYFTDSEKNGPIVGNFYHWYPVIINQNNDIDSLIVEVKNAIHNIPENGIGNSVFECNEDTWDILTDVWFDYCKFDFKSSIANNECIDNIEVTPVLHSNLSNPISIEVLELKDKLWISIRLSKDYCSNGLDCESFIEAYFESLDDIIKVCLNKETDQFTLSDFELIGEGLSQEKLADLLNEFQ